MHYPLSPMKAPFPEDDTVQKETISFSVYVFSRNKVVHVDYFDFKVCLVTPFFISEQCNTLAMMFSGCNNILDILVSVILSCSVLTVCDKSCSIADQNLTIFKSYKDGKD